MSLGFAVDTADHERSRTPPIAMIIPASSSGVLQYAAGSFANQGSFRGMFRSYF